jgi:3-isopropylmalate/(R)-2-methylmalate dehydratase large subunit
MMGGQTLVQKIIRRASGGAEALPGAVVVLNVDLAMGTDLSGNLWRAKLEELGAPVWDSGKIVLVNDHLAPGFDAHSAKSLQALRRFAADYGIANFHDMEGICHVILAERGYLRPGMFVAGGDSHTPMAGAFGSLAMGFGATDMVAIAATGQTWLLVPATMRIQLDGRLSAGVAAKDLMLLLCRRLGMNNASTVVQYVGAAVDAMPMSERLVLTNMAAELGCDSGIIEPDETTLAYLRNHGAMVDEDALSWVSDDDAEYVSMERFDARLVEPQVAAPHSPQNSGSVTEFAGISIDQAYVGACVGAKIDDLRMAAAALRGKKIAPATRLLVAPASRATTTQAAADGTLQTLLQAGATLLPTGCGACFGLGAGVLAEGDVCISTTNRNFKGRMGHKDASVYLASPYTVAASAVRGKIADPREFLCADVN